MAKNQTENSRAANNTTDAKKNQNTQKAPRRTANTTQTAGSKNSTK